MVLGWQLHQGSPRGLAAFRSSGWHMAGGYSSAMGIATDGWWIGVAAFLAWFVLLAMWVVSWREARPLLSLAVLAVPLFVAWKHSVVRQDVHVKILTFGLFTLTVLSTADTCSGTSPGPPPSSRRVAEQSLSTLRGTSAVVAPRSVRMTADQVHATCNMLRTGVNKRENPTGPS
jgi:hypothetical protein